jgi:hypothetical protein
VVTKLSKLGLCLTLALHTFILLTSSPLNFYPTPRDFRQIQFWYFQSIITKKIKESKESKKQMKRKNHGFFVVKGPNKFSTRSCVAL